MKALINSKALNIIFVVGGITVLIRGFIYLFYGQSGDFLGFSLASPWYGVLHIVLGVVILFPAYNYFKKSKLPKIRKLPKIGNKN